MAQIGRKFRMGIAAVVGLVSKKARRDHSRARLNYAPAGQYHPNQFILRRLGLVGQLPDLHGRGHSPYPLLIFVGTSTWYWAP